MCKIIQFPGTKTQEVKKEVRSKYQIGEKIYNRGDMVNHPGWFKITNYKDDNYGKRYDLQEIDGERTIKALFECSISEIDKGNGSTRFVTEKAYNELRNKQLEQLQVFINKNLPETVEYIEEENPTVGGQPEPVEITETTLKNLYCSIELQSEKEVFGRDLKDRYNEPAFYNKTSRGLKKAWKALKDQFDEGTTMHEAMQILGEHKIRTHSYCMMD